MSKSDTRVSVIGSGLSGLSCARSLHDSGYSVCLFDRGRNPGGRLASRVYPDEQDYGYDHGAPMIHARDPAFRAEAEKWVAMGIVKWWEPTIQTGDRSIRAPEPVIVGVPTMASIPRALSDGLDVRQSCCVEDARWDGSRWTLITRHATAHESQSIETDVLVLAMPAPQANRIVDLDETLGIELMRDISYASTWVCMLTIAVSEVLGSLPDILEPASDSMLERVCFAHRKPGRKQTAGTLSLVAYAKPQWTMRHLESESESVRELITRGIVETIKSELGFVIDSDQILHARVHRWGLAQAVNAYPESHAFNGAKRIGYCSDAMGGSGAESAYLSGISLAQAIRSSCPMG